MYKIDKENEDQDLDVNQNLLKDINVNDIVEVSCENENILSIL